MEITWGFLLLFTVFIFPGLIIRRLYFFGEFSKQFGYNDPLLKTVAYALVPGLINATAAFLLFDWLFNDIDLGHVFDTYKDLSDNGKRFRDLAEFSMDHHLRKEILPFLLLLYVLAIFMGAVSGQLVRWTAIDTKLKLFRFKNHWFYLFTGEHRRLTKYKPHYDTQNRFLFAKVDIMVESGGKNHLYSGALVDYELDPNDCRELSKVVLKDAHRYSKDANNAVVPKAIPGGLFVVDCGNMVNLNLTHVYEPDEAHAAHRQGKMQTWTNWVNVLALVSLIFVFIRIDSFHAPWYIWVMDLTVFAKLFFLFVLLQIVLLLNIYVQDPKTKVLRLASRMEWFARGLLIALFFLLTLGAERLAQAILGWWA